MSFPKDFLWGASSAAYQIEGAYRDDGRKDSIWDHFTHEPGHIAHGETGDVACDHYHRFREDVALMKEIGLQSYRFSVSWPRVIPDGTGAVNEKGLRFYSDLVDALLEAGIEPMVTLYHWDLPQALYEKGGWKNPESPAWFEEYTRVVARRLSDRVKHWMTFNEPQVFIGLGMQLGVMAPYERNDEETVMQVSRHVFLAHGRAVAALRKEAGQPLLIGLAPTGDVYLPESDAPEAVEKARKASFAVLPGGCALGNSWWADPIFRGRFSEDAEAKFGDRLPRFTEEEWALVTQPLDFYGFNIYQGSVHYPVPADGYQDYAYQGSPRTALGWNVTPEVMYWASKFLYERYGKPVLITENGMAGMDWVSLDGHVHDMQRIDFLHRYLLSLEKAIDDGIPVLGYCHWSVMDNLEWNSGYDPRFGLIHVDYRTQRRTLKDSARWYAEVIRTNGESLHGGK
ncbi:MAG: beta-glucosidase [Clostridia bacterium]|nr:beta-glucosidase [Clostridia bacterium]